MGTPAPGLYRENVDQMINTVDNITDRQKRTALNIELDTTTNSLLTPITEREFQLLRKLIYDKFGINLSDEKQLLVVGRLNKVLRKHGFSDFKRYYEYVQKDTTGEALTMLIDRISTNHTFFWRENDHFKFFTSKVLPEITTQLKSKNRNDLRIWCPGCSSGEESYTIAMLILEYFGPNLANWEPGILATDISTRVLNKAVAGIYDRENVVHMPAHLSNKYFSKCDEDNYQIKNKIRDMVLYRRLNLMRQDFPFKGKFQVIFCRNVMIYFDTPTREKLVAQFAEYMDTGGYLFIGHSESLGRENSYFRYIKPAIYQREYQV